VVLAPGRENERVCVPERGGDAAGTGPRRVAAGPVCGARAIVPSSGWRGVASSRRSVRNVGHPDRNPRWRGRWRDDDGGGRRRPPICRGRPGAGRGRSRGGALRGAVLGAASGVCAPADASRRRPGRGVRLLTAGNPAFRRVVTATNHGATLFSGPYTAGRGQSRMRETVRDRNRNRWRTRYSVFCFGS
jgi:hypothetical protein